MARLGHSDCRSLSQSDIETKKISGSLGIQKDTQFVTRLLLTFLNPFTLVKLVIMDSSQTELLIYWTDALHEVMI